MTCEHAHLDGSYVLGALSPAERQRFEQHLATAPTAPGRYESWPACPGSSPGSTPTS